MQQDSFLSFDLPAVARKKVSIGFDGGLLSSDAGVLLLRGVEQRLSIATRLAACLTDHRDPNRIDHTVVEMLRLRMFAIAAATRTATTARRCDMIRCSKWRSVVPLRAAIHCARSQQCRDWRTRRAGQRLRG
jgi:hypothetical protein